MLAALLSVGIHSWLLTVDLGQSGIQRREASKPTPVTVTLAYRQPAPPEPPAIEKPQPPAAASPRTKPEKNLIQDKPKIKTPPEPRRKKRTETAAVNRMPDVEEEQTDGKTDEASPASPVPRESRRNSDRETAQTRSARVSSPPSGKSDPENIPDVDASGDKRLRRAEPLYRLNPPPKYPRIARRRGYQGQVILEVLVDLEGKVVDLKIHQSSGYSILDKAALKSVRNWRFEPARRGRKPIEMWVRVPLRFQIQ